ncbi:MAG TPA: nucleotidyltransferase domain-containing protein [Spirochaetota bacterium]|nr:nucleotidyltransferase domain-containing protein [Spirochaetota bacterium]HQO01524.1 nucleotidyltransferase domain-containing protein [Spirochaetota bacterium]HQP47857.1 nucleotidyltransferase domain-containing protein [Spirochaetota bacterium]
MTENEIKNTIAKTIREECIKQGYTVKKLILFGSRASGEFSSGSDWDFIAILDKPIEWKDKMKLWLPINRKLGKLGADADVLFKSEEDFEKDRTDTGKISYYAYKYGTVA